MEKDDEGSTMIRMGVSGWMFLLLPAYPGCPGSKAVKRSLLLLLLLTYLLTSVLWLCILSVLHISCSLFLLVIFVLCYCLISYVCSQNSEMWLDFNTISDVNQAAVIWLLTLEKQGCSAMLQAGMIWLSTAVIIFFIVIALTLLLCNQWMNMLLVN